jgi:hypothetical protein
MHRLPLRLPERQSKGYLPRRLIARNSGMIYNRTNGNIAFAEHPRSGHTPRRNA